MPRVSIELAGPADDPDLLRLLAAMPMPGPIRVSYRRNPSYFDAMAVEGRFHQVLIARDTDSGEVVGMCNRSVKDVYLNGKAVPAGYISGLRLLSPYRGRRCLAQGYAFLRELHKDRRTAFYLSTVLRGNNTATLISKSRTYFPRWRKLASFHNLAIALNQSRRAPKPHNLLIRTAKPSDRERMVTFLNRAGARRQFFPVYTVPDFFTGRGLMKNLHPEDIILGFEKDHLCGLVAGWNQQAFRQSVIDGYHGGLSCFRPLYNMVAALHRKPKLPPKGSLLNYCYLSLVCIRDDDPQVCALLIDRLMRAKAGLHDFMMAGMSDNDPLLPCLTRYRHIRYPAELFWIDPESASGGEAKLPAGVPYLELGAL